MIINSDKVHLDLFLLYVVSGIYVFYMVRLIFTKISYRALKWSIW